MATVPSDDHIIRYCKPRFYDNGLISPDLWKLREKEEYISCFWFEFRGSLDEIKKDISQRLHPHRGAVYPKLQISVIAAAANHCELPPVEAIHEDADKTAYSRLCNTTNCKKFLARLAAETEKALEPPEAKPASTDVRTGDGPDQGPHTTQ